MGPPRRCSRGGTTSQSHSTRMLKYQALQMPHKLHMSQQTEHQIILDTCILHMTAILHISLDVFFVCARQLCSSESSSVKLLKAPVTSSCPLASMELSLLSQLTLRRCRRDLPARTSLPPAPRPWACPFELDLLSLTTSCEALTADASRTCTVLGARPFVFTAPID